MSRRDTDPWTRCERLQDELDAKGLSFKEYELISSSTAVYPGIGDNFIYPALGLCGEAGEIAEKIKKIIRDDGGKVSDEKREALKKELGDVLWYVAALCGELKLSMADVAQANIDKLQARKQKGTLQGSGDNR